MIAAAQGLLLVFLLFQKHRSLYANKYLTLLMFCYTCILIHLLLQDSGIYAIFPYLFLISSLALVAMPLHYLYTKHLLHRTKIFIREDLYHFIPAAVYSLVLFFTIPSLTANFSIASSVSLETTPLILKVFNFGVITEGIVYLVLSLRLINRFNLRVKDVFSTIEALQLSWLRNITFAGIIAITLFLIEEMFLLDGINLSNFILSSVFFALYVYGIGYGGLLKSEVFANPSFEKNMHAVEEIETAEEKNISSKYERSGLTEELSEKYLVGLLTAMTENKLYLNSSLTLNELSEQLSISSHNISEVINSKLGKNFYDFINAYRVEEFKQRIKNPEFSNYSLLAVAFESGFSSKSSFNTIFKKHTGITPSEYRKQNIS